MTRTLLLRLNKIKFSMDSKKCACPMQMRHKHMALVSRCPLTPHSFPKALLCMNKGAKESPTLLGLSGLF